MKLRFELKPIGRIIFNRRWYIILYDDNEELFRKELPSNLICQNDLEILDWLRVDIIPFIESLQDD
jgi:hypothetical protein